ncbi:MAG: EAL domain-containing protein [Pirellulales bacterium]|nr:EAL domain-containing protein [Pirellulales bacterium]
MMLAIPAKATGETTWLLSGQLSADQPVRSIAISGSPFLVGRHPSASLTIPSPTVSTSHAELSVEGGELWVRDLESTNGTFVNGARLEGACVVHSGDLIQFAEVVFRVGLNRGYVDAKTMAGDSTDRALALIQFDKLMAERAVLPHFQPIIDYQSGGVAGYEVLGRSRLFGLGTPHAMFSAAAVLDLEAELSRMMRAEAMLCAASLPGSPLLFVNTHPAELAEQGVLEFSLRELRELAPRARLVLEIHEAAVTCVRQMRELLALLHDLDMELAYDNFGAGQARLVELSEVPPEYLKFDIELVRGIDRGSPERKRMLASLVKIVSDLGIASLAEGVESEGEAEACRQLNFDFAQGFYYGKPALASSFIAVQKAGDSTDTDVAQ